MKVAMVKHKPYGKVFWFEIPEHLVGKLQPGFRVACNTARGRRYGTVVAADLDEQDVKEVMLASGATFPLSTIEATTQFRDIWPAQSPAMRRSQSVFWSSIIPASSIPMLPWTITPS